MSDIKNEYDRLLSEIEETISNEEERKIVKEKVNDVSLLFINMIERMNDVMDTKITDIEERQTELDRKVDKITNSLSEIESDIYDEEEMGDFDFEIVCPYCNNEFVTDISAISEEKSEIRCPECENIIELDWNADDEEEGCSGHCHGCHGCSEEDEDSEDDM